MKQTNSEKTTCFHAWYLEARSLSVSQECFVWYFKPSGRRFLSHWFDKMQEEKKQKFRDELENITRELVKLNNEFEILQQQIDEIDEVEKNAEMKELCSQKWVLKARIDSLENRRNHLINLLNTAKD